MSSVAPTPLTSQADAVKAYLAGIPGIAFRAPGDLVQFEAGLSTDAALKVFADTKVTGAPVYIGTPLYDEMTDVDAGGFSAAVAVSAKDYIGIVDVADLASLILTRGLKRKTPQGLFAKIGDLFALDDEHSVKSAVNLSTTHRFFALPLSGNLAQAAAVMARKRVHRIAISNPDKDNRIEGMVTGSSIIRALRDNLPVLGALGGAQIGLLFATGRDRVVTGAVASTTARECLESLLQHGVLGMPLVGADGTVVANISLSDVRKLAGLSAEDAEKLLDAPAVNLVKDATGAVRAPVTVKPSDTLATVIELMTTTKVHRVYVTDRAGRPIGAITVTDVIRLVLSPSLTAYTPGSEEGATEEAKGDSEEAFAVSPDTASAAASAKVNPELAKLLSKVTAGEFIVRDGVRIEKLIDIPHDASAVAVLRELSANNLSALPVYREESEGVPDLMSFIPYAYPPEKRYVGWVDAGDLCGLLLDKGLRARSEGGILGKLKALARDDDRTSVAAVNYSDNDPFWAIPAERSMAQVIRVLGNCKVHRLAVVDVDEGNHIIGIVTQSAIVKYLAEHKALLGEVASCSVAAFTRPAGSMIKIPLSATVAEALRLLVTCKITGAPVIDEDDHVVANLSVSDVRYLGKIPQDEVDRVLALPVLAFLTEVKAKASGSSNVSLTPAVLHPTDSFGAAVDLLASSGLHRLYVVDERNCPVGIFTLTDAVKAISAAL